MVLGTVFGRKVGLPRQTPGIWEDGDRRYKTNTIKRTVLSIKIPGSGVRTKGPERNRNLLYSVKSPTGRIPQRQDL